MISFEMKWDKFYNEYFGDIFLINLYIVGKGLGCELGSEFAGRLIRDFLYRIPSNDLTQ